jgi:hypothetical protein
MTPRDAFQTLLTQFQKFKESRPQKAQEQNTLFLAELRDLVGPRFKPTKKNPELTPSKALTLLGEEQMAELTQKHENLYQIEFDRIGKEIKDLEKQLEDLAQTCPILPGENWLTYRTQHSTSFNSQGLGADHYARTAAEMARRKPEIYGIPNRLRVEHCVILRGTIQHEPTPDEFPGNFIKTEYLYVEEYADYLKYSKYLWESKPQATWDSNTYIVEVAVTEPLDIEILKYRNDPQTLREWVKDSWRKGINPRVLMPFLPYGYEEEMNLNYFGGEK